jgi:hypothetical protein
MRGFFLRLDQTRLLQSCWILLVTCLLAAPVWLLGQSYFGSVTGVLTDPSGAVIPGAKVTLTDQEKGYTFNTVSDGTGRYLYRSIPPGVYSVTAEMTGFEKAVRTGIRVDININATANLSLKVSGLSQTIEVTSQTQALDAQDATTGLVVDRKFINDLPLIDRNVMDLTMLTPGVTEADDQCVGCGGTNFVSNGSRNATADILMDGATVTNYEPNGGVTEMTYTPSSEAVDEFRVEQSNFSAEYGFSGASVVNMVTRSGTTGSTTWMVIRFLRCTARTLAAPSAGPSSRTRLSFSLTTMARAKARWAPTRPEFPPTSSAMTAILARSARHRVEHSTTQACAALPKGRFGILIAGRTSRSGIMGREPCAAPSSPTTTSVHMPVRAIRS